MIKLTKTQWQQVYDILTEECGAPEEPRTDFLTSQAHGTTEFRFGGSLGFGGKLFNSGDGLHVACYFENGTPERTVAIEAANRRLKRFTKNY